MSGPISLEGASIVDSASAARLTEAQWRALARLADRLVALEDAGAGPLGQAASEWALKAAAIAQGRDFATLGQELLQALKGLSEAGVWAAIADHAGSVKTTLDAIPWDASAIQNLVVNAEALQHDLAVLRRFAQRLAALEGLLAGPAGQALSETWVEWSTATESLDLAALGKELTQTLHALSESGALRLLSENLPYLANTLKAVSASSPAALSTLGPFFDAVREDMVLAHKLAERARRLEIFLAGPTGTAAIGAWATASQVFVDQDLGGLTRDLVDLLGAWRRMGLFPVLKDAGGGLVALARLWQTADGSMRLQELVQSWTAPNPGGPGWQRAAALWEAVKTASADQEPAEGGVKGLYKLLADPVVQDAARQAAVMFRLVTTVLAQGRSSGPSSNPPP